MKWVLIVFLGLATPVAANPSGPIRVIDGDTLDVGSTRVRLHGIDAPEANQTCMRPDGAVWACGRWVEEQARGLYEGKRARCEALDRDRYGRVVARCQVRGKDLGAALVSAGLATAFRRYSSDYVDIEKEAVVAGRGIFGSEMTAPQAFRNAQAPVSAAPEGCAIKGNISSGGHIYHMPGQEHYARTQINTARGERWFCSEAEARAAGWRRARR
ncbi:MAG: thermonuclease family protein [Pseudomonadota bacterium]